MLARKFADLYRSNHLSDQTQSVFFGGSQSFGGVDDSFDGASVQACGSCCGGLGLAGGEGVRAATTASVVALSAAVLTTTPASDRLSAQRLSVVVAVAAVLAPVDPATGSSTSVVVGAALQ